jgi:organic radical activating enzyme
VPASLPTETSLVEVFSSIQGEGILVGCRQIFLRFPDCNLNCRYCDTPFQKTTHCILEDPPGSGALKKLTNPRQLSTLVKTFSDWCTSMPGAHHSFSLTGGEPLLHAELLQQWLPELRKLLPIYLETNGTLPDQLEPLLPLLDWVSVDFKLQSTTGQPTDWATHQRFLTLAKRVNCYVKLVVGRETTEQELRRAAEIVAEVDEDVPLIVQPVTVDAKVGVPTGQLLAMQQTVAECHPNVRVIPQTHVFMNLM